MASAVLKGGQPFKWAVISAGKMAADFTAAIRQLPGHEGEAAVPPPCHVPAGYHCRRAVPTMRVAIVCIALPRAATNDMLTIPRSTAAALRAPRQSRRPDKWTLAFL